MDWGLTVKRASEGGNDPKNCVCPHVVYTIMVGCCLNQFCTPGCVRLHAHALMAISQCCRHHGQCIRVPEKRASDCGNDPKNRVCPHNVYTIMVGRFLNQFCTPGCVRLHTHALMAISHCCRQHGQWIRVSLESDPRIVGMTQKIMCVHIMCTLSWWGVG